MKMRQTCPDATTLASFFERVFAASEGPEEGALIGTLVRDLITQTPPEDIHCFCTTLDGDIQAAAIFTRLRFGGDAPAAYLLSPMAVATDQQRRGLGQTLISTALGQLAEAGAELAFTYGDPAYYARTGFAPVSTDIAPPPQPLSMPHGWLAQSLKDKPLSPLPSPSLCAPALMRPGIW